MTTLPVASMVALSMLAVGLVGLVGLLGLYALRRRSITTVLTITVLVPVVSLAVGVLGMTAWAPPRAMDRLVIPVGVAVGLSIVIAVAVAKIIMKASVALRRAVELLGDETQFPPRHAPISELSALATALNDTQERLREARGREAELDRSRRDMLIGIGHDLRTPLARLRSIVEALQEEGLEDPTVLSSYLAVLRSQTVHLSTLVDELLELARINSGLIEPVVASLALDELVSNALADAATHARRRGVALTGEAPSRVVVDADVQLTTRLLDNLVDNAIAETPAGHGVHIRAASRAEGVTLEVQDSCGGMPDTDLERVFDPGYRGDGSRRTDGRGLGLGLTIARGLAEAQGARITAENVGGGCRFRVPFMPQVATRASSRTMTSHVPPPPSG